LPADDAGTCSKCGRHINSGYAAHVAECHPVAEGVKECPKCGRALRQGARWHISACDGIRRDPDVRKREAQRHRRHSRRSGPYARLFRRASLTAQELHTREGMFLRRVQEELCRQLGGDPSMAQALLIDRAAKAALRLELFDREFANGKKMTLQDGRVYSSLHSSLRLILRDLGMKPKKAERRVPTIEELTERINAEE
jgi:hypothetical protein